MQWLEQMTISLADGTGTDPEAITLPAPVRRDLLDIARVASHTSGDRINAPLLCYVLGMLVGRGVELERALAIVKREAEAG